MVSQTGFNPAMYGYSGLQGGLNDDFMYNAYVCQPDATKVAQQPSFNGLYSMYNQQAGGDTFEKQGGSGLLSGLKIGVIGGLGTAAGAYYFGGEKLGMNIYKDGKFTDAFLKTLEDDKILLEEAKKLKNAEIKKICGVGPEYYECIEKIAKGEKWPEHIKRPNVLKNLGTEKAKAMVEKVGKLTPEKFTEQVARTHTLDGAKAHLDTLVNQETLIKGMKDSDSLTELIKNNAKTFGIEGTEAEIATKAQKVATEMGGGKTAALKHLRNTEPNALGLIQKQEGVLNDVRASLSGKVSPYFDTAKNALKEGAPKDIAKAVKSFKLSKAGKYGLIAAGIGVALGWLFGKS